MATSSEDKTDTPYYMAWQWSHIDHIFLCTSKSNLAKGLHSARRGKAEGRTLVTDANVSPSLVLLRGQSRRFMRIQAVHSSRVCVALVAS